MRIERVRISNFRLLTDVELALEDQTTVVVGRNNSGKTSLSEVMHRFLEGKSQFKIEDFSSASYDGFCDALKAKNDGLEEYEIRLRIPKIQLRMTFRYNADQPQFGPLSDFVIDLDPDCNEAVVILQYELREGQIDALFEGQPAEELDIDARQAFFKALRERIPALYTTTVWAEDPNDPTNRRPMSLPAARSLIKTGFIRAQRWLDDTTSRETGILARVLEGLFTTATSPSADEDDRKIREELQEAVRDIQDKIDKDFSSNLKALIPTLETFGYPGLGGPELRPETTLDVERLLSDHTTINYAGHSGVALPESYNGLGARNLIYILLQLVGFYRMFRAEPDTPGVHLIFIEEPEAHLHPQMQEVFIRQLSKIVKQFNVAHPNEDPWPVQLVVSTHSSHIANEAGFETLRYFLAVSDSETGGVRHTKVKDLRQGLRETPRAHAEFLHQYLTLTRCDLFFADKAVMVEGTTERLLLPAIIRKLENAEPDGGTLSSQYITVMEVGGAYAHIFFRLLDFLELQSLVITDLDSVLKPRGDACAVHEGTATSNACLKAWFGDENSSLAALLAADDASKVLGSRRIAFQRPEAPGGPCGRTFEDAFMLANPVLFKIIGERYQEQELVARSQASKVKKSQFALEYAISETTWIAPGYILDGLRWLAHNDTSAQGAPSGVTLGTDSEPDPQIPVGAGDSGASEGANGDE